jgi:hypothetical protein
MFLQRFTKGLPIFHVPSWKSESKPEMLLSMMQAYESTYLDTLESKVMRKYMQEAVPNILANALVRTIAVTHASIFAQV